MPVFSSPQLIRSLKEDAQSILERALLLPDAGDEVLNHPPAAGSWSIAQVLEHLNFYSRAYLPRLQQRYGGGGPQRPQFTPGFLGQYFTKMMQPGRDGVVANRMSAPKDSRPAAALDGPAVVGAFIRHQQELLQLLDAGKDLDVRIPNSLTTLIRLKAGDTFRFLIAHQQRHMAQAARAARAIGYTWGADR